MTSTENNSEIKSLKVYELAKELGIDSITLLDKLGSINIKVKNHMSELGPEEVSAAKQVLLTKKSASEASKKGATKTPSVRARKKAGEPESSSTTATKTAKTAKSSATLTKKSLTESKASKPAETESDSSSTGKSAAPTAVLRRRTSADTTEGTSTTKRKTVATEQNITEEEIQTQSATPDTSDSLAIEESIEIAFESPTIEFKEERTEEVHTPPSASIPSSKTVTRKSILNRVEASSPSKLKSVEVPATESHTHSKVAETISNESATEIPSAIKQESVSTAAPAQRPPVVLPPRPTAPRRSILKIVEPTPPPKPNIVKAAGPVIQPKKPGAVASIVKGDSDFKIIRMTKENLDQMAEEENAKKRGGGKVELEIKPEDIRFADYRKKEMVFLPKKKKLPHGKEIKKTQITTPKAIKRVVEMHETISVQDFANQLNVKAVEVIRKLMMMGQKTSINQSIDFDTACLVATEFQYEVKNISFKEEQVLQVEETMDESKLQGRPPVVTIMGHVDHGKTSLLDAIREANIAGGEAGGITQHIGAYSVVMNGKTITFIDTPGHEAFTSMRARGANVTDIVILVVAADDGVMPQTREALSHAQAAGVPIIVAMNKIDKPAANPEKIKQQMAELNLLAEDWGGQTMFVPVSAIQKLNLDKLLEAILLQAEIMDLKANPEGRATGTVLEGRVEKGRGPVVTLLVKQGTLKVGDPIVSGIYSGRVKAMLDHKGKPIKEVTPGLAAEVLGFEGVPNAGDLYHVALSEADARTVAQNRLDVVRKQTTNASGMSLDEVFSKIQAGTLKELPVILKADVFGSVEAIKENLQKLSNDQVKVKVIFAAPGGITESDVLLATASSAIILGFNVRPETKARQVAEASHIEIKCYSIIYELFDDVKKSMLGLLDKKKVEKFLGRAEVRQVFSIPKMGVIAGSSVIDGKIIRGANVRLLRDSRVIYEGKMTSLKRFKDDAKEVAQGFECGIGLENYNDIKLGDLIEAYQVEMIAGEFHS